MVIFDELDGRSIAVGEPRFRSATITVRDLIRARVELELDGSARRNAPVVPGETERRLNRQDRVFAAGVMFAPEAPDGPCRRTEALVEIAEAGFNANRFFLLVGDRQAESLDEAIDLGATGDAVFLLLTPLQGG